MADADLGRFGDLVQLLAGRVKQEWTALVFASLLMLILFVVVYARLSKPFASSSIKSEIVRIHSYMYSHVLL
jgi:hypothetical protein